MNGMTVESQRLIQAAVGNGCTYCFGVSPVRMKGIMQSAVFAKKGSVQHLESIGPSNGMQYLGSGYSYKQGQGDFLYNELYSSTFGYVGSRSRGAVALSGGLQNLMLGSYCNQGLQNCVQADGLGSV